MQDDRGRAGMQSPKKGRTWAVARLSSKEGMLRPRRTGAEPTSEGGWTKYWARPRARRDGERQTE